MEIDLQDCFSEDEWCRILTLAEQERLPPAIIITRLAATQISDVTEAPDVTEASDDNDETPDDKGETPDETPVGELDGISGRTAGALRRGGVEQLGQLLSIPFGSVGEIDGIGSAALDEITTAAEKIGIDEDTFGTYDWPLSETEDADESEDADEWEDADESEETPEDVEEVLGSDDDVLDEFRDLYKEASQDDQEAALSAVKAAIRLLVPHLDIKNKKQATKKVIDDLGEIGFDSEDPETYPGAVEYVRNQMPVTSGQLETLNAIDDVQEASDEAFGKKTSALTVGQADSLIDQLEDDEDTDDGDPLDDYL